MKRILPTLASKMAVVALLLATSFLALPLIRANADSCVYNTAGTLPGPFNVGVRAGFNIHQSKLLIAHCRATFHWQDSARAKACAGLPPDQGPWLSFMPVDANGDATQGEVRVARIGVPNAAGDFDHDVDVTRDIQGDTIARATHITLSIEVSACNR